MNYEESYSSYFEDALRIHAICADNGHNENDARLLTYMHAKASECEQGIDYFYSPATEDIDALEIMLGKSKKKICIPPVINLSEKEQDAIEMILTIANRISRLDKLLAQECGMENRLCGELNNRLRLYKDPEFRDKMISIYKNSILTEISKYDKSKITQAFSKYLEAQYKKETELYEMTGIKNSEE